jgi:polyketide synthase PksJ
MKNKLIITDAQYQSHREFWEQQATHVHEAFQFAPFAAEAGKDQTPHVVEFSASTSELDDVAQLAKGQAIARLLLLQDLWSMTLRSFMLHPEQVLVHTPMLIGKSTSLSDRIPVLNSALQSQSYKEHLGQFKQRFVDGLRYADFPIHDLLTDADSAEFLHTNVCLIDCDQQQELPDQADYDLLVAWKSVKSGLDVKLTSNGKFSEENLRAIGAKFQQMLKHFPALNETVGEWLANAQKLESTVGKWEIGETKEFTDASVIEAFHNVVQAHPEKVALEDGMTSYTYRELDERTNQIAGAIVKEFADEESIGMLIERKAVAIVAMLAIMKAGKVYVPQDPVLPQERIKFVFDDAGVKSVIAESDFFGTLKAAGMTVLDVNIELGHSDLKSLVNSSLAYIIYTSGTTGKPKGVEVGHHSLINMVQSQIELFGIQESDKVLQFAALTFDASISEIFMALLSGATLSMFEHETILNPNKMQDEMVARNISVATIPPSYLNKLSHDKVKMLRVLITAGESPIDSDVKALAPALNYFNAFGPTEFTVCSSLHHVADKPSFPVPIGKPIYNAKNLVVNAWGYRVPEGTIGYLCAAGAGLAKGYHNQPALTAERFAKLPASNGETAYHTGDLASWTAQGELLYHGRDDHQIKINGSRVELMEVKSALLASAGVQDTFIDFDKSGAKPRLIAYVKVSEALTEEALQQYLRKFLMDYMLPHKILFVEDIPLNHHGKVDVAALRIELSKQSEVIQLPATDLQKTICGIWREILDVDVIGIDQNFFELGGDSISIARLSEELSKAFNVEITLTELFGLPTVTDIEGHLKAEQATSEDAEALEQRSNSGDVAVIGMSCRFPGANNYREFWNNLTEGKESLTTFSQQELEEAGVTGADIEAGFIPANMALENKGHFDASFFSIRPDEAELLNPQTRMMLAMVHSSLEDAGIALPSVNYPIGLYVGASNDFIWEAYSALRLGDMTVDAFTASQLANKDFMATYIAYKLNLTGPAVAMQSACSTSLLSIHSAAKELLHGNSKVVVAGGATLSTDSNRGYFPQEDSILSNDGHCRPFDQNATGTLSGEGAGAVVLKRLEDAQRDGDQIYAVIKGSAINNDGNRKVGYTAPSIQGQTDCIQAALRDAGKQPAEISYIEAHGTGTKIGDPIEVAALQKAFGKGTVGDCSIGSVKSNIGHLDSAAGIAGFMKVVLSLKHRTKPVSLNVDLPNKGIDWDAGAFRVQQETEEWKGDYPLVAGISSFGIGGTNVHLIVEEAQVSQPQEAATALLLFSGKTAQSTENQAKSFQRFGEVEASLFTNASAQTLQMRRQHFNYRGFTVASNAEELARATIEVVDSNDIELKKAPVVFMFPGQGTAHEHMVKWLRTSNKEFAKAFAQVSEVIQAKTSIDIEDAIDHKPELFQQTIYAQLAIFAAEYSLSALVKKLGVTPDYVIGHSLGEFMVAIEAGTLELEEAVDLIIARDKAMQTVVDGRALSVLWTASPAQLQARLPEQLSLAAVNSDTSLLVSGPGDAVVTLQKELTDEGIQCKLIDVNFPPHSRYLAENAASYKEAVAGWPERQTKLPILSTVEGELLPAASNITGDYWFRNLTETVHFKAALLALDKVHSGPVLLLEVGPENTLSKLTRQIKFKQIQPRVISFLQPRERGVEQEAVAFQVALGKLWSMGKALNFEMLYDSNELTTQSLPTYAFQNKNFTTEVNLAEVLGQLGGTAVNSNRTPKVYASEWRSAAPVSPLADQNILLFEAPVLEALTSCIAAECKQLIKVVPSNSFEHNNQEYKMNPASEQEYSSLVKGVNTSDTVIDTVVYEWPMLDTDSMTNGLNSLVALMKNLEALNSKSDGQLAIKLVTSRGVQVFRNRRVDPTQALIHGAATVLQKEFPQFAISVVDIDAEQEETEVWKDEFLARIDTSITAIRMGTRWEVDYVEQDAIQPNLTSLSVGSTLLITGGASGVGKAIGEHFEKNHNVKIVVIGRRLKEEVALNNWDYLQVDLSDAAALQKAISAYEEANGNIQAVIHAAGVIDQGGMIHTRDWASIEKVMSPKVNGTVNLWNHFQNHDLSFFVNCSSLSSVAGPFGELAYAAANAFQNQFSTANANAMKSIAWCSWLDTGMANRITEELSDAERKQVLANHVTNSEAMQLLESSLSRVNPVSFVSREELNLLVAQSSQEVAAANESEEPSVEKQLDEGIEIFLQHIAAFFGHEALRPQDDFLELGGDSLRAVALINDLRKAYGVQLSVKELYDNAQLQNLYNFLQNGEGGKHAIIPAEIELQDSYPLSMVQQKLWIINEKEGSLHAYNIFGSTALYDLNVELFQQTLEIIISRFEVLRTTMLLDDGDVRQRFVPTANFRWEVSQHDFTNESDVEAAVDAISNQVIGERFDLLKGPLFRFDLARVDDRTSVFFYVFSHSIFDGISSAILTKQIGEVYQQLLSNQVVESAGEPFQYKEFVAFESALIDEGSAKSYWNNRLANDLAPLALPFDFPRPARPNFEGELAVLKVHENIASEFQAFVKKQQTTLFSAFVAAVNLLLHSFSFSEEITVGSPVSNRLATEFEQQIGNFLNYLVVRHRVDGEQTVSAFMQQVQQDTLEMLSYQQYPYEHLIRDLNPTVEQGHNPFYDVLIITSSNTMPLEESANSDLEAGEIVFDSMRSLLDLTFFSYDYAPGNLELRIEYGTSLFTRDTIKGFMQRLEQILGLMNTNSEQSIAQLIASLNSVASQEEVNHSVELIDEDF